MTYFNTTNLTGDELADAVESSAIQREAVMALFAVRKKLSPWQVQGYIHGRTITGIRCAITTLTDDGKLRKTEEKRMGPHGRKEYFWELVER